MYSEARGWHIVPGGGWDSWGSTTYSAWDWPLVVADASRPGSLAFELPAGCGAWVCLFEELAQECLVAAISAVV